MKRIILLFVAVLALGSCTNYYISLDSFKEQFSTIDSAHMKRVQMMDPLGLTSEYLANGIKFIKCTDDDGKECSLMNSPSIETRITYGYNNRRIVFYFDRVIISRGKVYGLESRILGIINNGIPVDSVKKIEVQDGGKRYSYTMPLN